MGSDGAVQDDLRHQVSARYLLGQTQEAAGNSSGAIESYRVVLREDPSHSSAAIRLGALLYDAGKRKEAEETLRAVLRNEPENAYAMTILAIVLQDRRPREARELFLAARKQSPELAVVWERYALFCDLKGTRAEKKLVESLYREAIRLSPEDAETHARLAMHIFEKDGREEEAAALAEEALRLDPQLASAYVLLGYAAIARRDYASAREHALTALRADPEDAAAVRLLVTIKASRSVVLGIWWQFAYLITYAMSSRTRTAVFLFFWVVVKPLALLFLIYILLGNAVLTWMVRRELRNVALAKRF